LLSIETVLEICGFAIGVAGLVPLLLTPDAKRRIVVSIAAVITVILIFGVLLYQEHQKELQVARMSEDITMELFRLQRQGKEAVPYDDLSQNIFQVNASVENEALDRLYETRTVGHEILNLHDDSGHQFDVWGYYLTLSDH